MTTAHPPTVAFASLAIDVVARHDTWLQDPGWPSAPAQTPAQTPVSDVVSDLASDLSDTGLWHWVQHNHRNNSMLWAEEDLARRTTVAAADIAANKRAIDGYNQARNDATERIDELLLLALGLVDEASARSDAPQSRANPSARLNSETAGSMVDRLSILALKVKAMRLQSLRQDVPEQQRSASLEKLARLEQQRNDLAQCLQALLQDTQAGRAYFKVYRQFKMYNDARFNPELVKEQNAKDAKDAKNAQQRGSATAPTQAAVHP